MGKEEQGEKECNTGRADWPVNTALLGEPPYWGDSPKRAKHTLLIKKLPEEQQLVTNCIGPVRPVVSTRTFNIIMRYILA